MSKTKRNCDSLVDAFVRAVNLSPRGVLNRDHIPKGCMLSAGEWPDTFDWQIARCEDSGWLPDLERRLPFPIPPTFRSLIARYSFPLFVAGPLTLFAAGLTEPDSNVEEFRSAIFADTIRAPFLLKQGFLPFARPADWSYDPVCFDYRNAARKSEPAVVRIDHEEILCNDRLRVVEQLAEGFDVLVEELIGAAKIKTPEIPSSPQP